MSVKPSKNRFEFDAANVLRAAGLGTVAIDTRSSALSLEKLAAYWNDADDRAVPQQFAVIVEVEAITTAGGQTHDVEIAVGNDAAGADVVLETRRVTATGRSVFVVTREALKAAQNDASHLTVNMNVGGSGTPAVAFNAYVAPLNG